MHFTDMVVGVESDPELRKQVRHNSLPSLVTLLRTFEVMTFRESFSLPVQIEQDRQLTKFFTFNNPVFQRPAYTFPSFYLISIVTSAVEKAIAGLDRIVDGLHITKFSMDCNSNISDLHLRSHSS